MAERYPYRTVMVTCDLARMLLMALVAMRDLPLPVVLALLLAAALFAPPFDAARSATLPAVLTGDRYVVGVALYAATSQPVQVFGYFAGRLAGRGQPAARACCQRGHVRRSRRVLVALRRDVARSRR